MSKLRVLIASVFGTIAITSMTLASFAATTVLPHVPGAAEKVTKGGTTGAAASVEGSTGSALEPYLITFLLPVFGIIVFAVCLYVDKVLRRSLGASEISVRTR